MKTSSTERWMVIVRSILVMALPAFIAGAASGKGAASPGDHVRALGTGASCDVDAWRPEHEEHKPPSHANRTPQ